MKPSKRSLKKLGGSLSSVVEVTLESRSNYSVQKMMLPRPVSDTRSIKGMLVAYIKSVKRLKCK